MPRRERKFPALFYTPLPQIDEVIADVELQARDVRLYYAVDAKEVVDFCFPLNPYSPSEPDLEAIANDQTALYEVFTLRDPRPVLMPHYAEEIDRHLRFVQATSQRASDELEDIQSKLIEGAELPELAEQDSHQKVTSLESAFNRILSAAIGIESAGADRFNSLVSKRLLEIGDIDDPFVREAQQTYKPQLIEHICDILGRGFETRQLDRAELHQRRRSARIDAMVLDWLIHLNRTMADAYAAHRSRTLFLYLSSAPKTQKVFEDGRVQRELPKINGCTFSFWRGRSQILLPATAGESNNPAHLKEHLAHFRNLCQEIQSISEEIAKGRGVGNACDDCALQGGYDSSCRWLAVCTRVKGMEETMRKRTQPMLNLALLSRIKAYIRFLKLTPRIGSNREYFQQVQRLIADHGVADVALKRLLDTQSYSMSAALFARWTGQAVAGNIASARPDQTDNALPPANRTFEFVFPHLAGPYSDIANTVYKYHRDIGANAEQKAEILKRAVLDFLEIDREKVALPISDHELTRCLLYLSFLGERGTQLALDNAKSMVGVFPESQVDFLYVQLLAALRLRKHQDAHTTASEGIRLAPNDPRFYHGRSVNTFRWRIDEKSAPYCPLELDDAVVDGSRAIALYRTKSDWYRPLITSACNNLAYLFTYRNSGEFELVYDLNRAQAMLDVMRANLDSSGWTEPEYLHTAAHVQYLSGLRCREQNDLVGARQMLDRARRDIDRAKHIRPKPLYTELSDLIRKAESGLPAYTAS